MKRHFAALALIQSITLIQMTYAQEAVPLRDLGGVVAFTGYPGGLLFHNAFRGERSTRFLLLKAIVRNPASIEQFELTKSQVKVIEALQPITRAKPTNDSPDEPTYDAKFYSFLNQSQQDRLTLLAIRFDGLAALSQRSIANRIGLEASTLIRIQEIVDARRKSVILPDFRLRFGGQASEQDKLMYADLDARLVVLTNFEIATTLSEKEREKLVAFMKTYLPAQLIEYLAATAKLPEGLDHLHKLVEE